MNRFRAPLLACAVVLVTACVQESGPELRHVQRGLGPPVVRDGAIYTPVAIGPHGCVLYHVRIPGGQAPAALMYRNEDDKFSHGRPDRCVTGGGAP
ncbi:MAG: hypothetical protein OXI81_01855 [Paracoccaceae bacterium]|nr:hypothetical protein [Paracoccaceae bacterium]